MLKRLQIYYFFVGLPFFILLAGAAFFFEPIKSTVTRNPHPQINYTIFVIIVIGGFLVLINSRRLMSEARTLVGFIRAVNEGTGKEELQRITAGYRGVLASILQMISTSTGRGINRQEQAALEHELANVRSSITRRNILPQYFTGLLVGMGLLGTFIGLLATLSDISTLISSFGSLDVSTVDPIQVFQTMIERMKAPMRGMSIAFSASMFGLLGSITMGLMMVGIRRFQNDIISTLSSQVARHIEMALSREGANLQDRMESGGNLSSEILLRIEERLAEGAEGWQRFMTGELAEMRGRQEQMVGALKGQTAANEVFQKQLEIIGRHLQKITELIDKNGQENIALLADFSAGVSEAAGKARSLARVQIEELQVLGRHLEEMTESMSRGDEEIIARLTALEKAAGEEMRQSEVLANKVVNGVGIEFKQLAGRLDSTFSLAGNLEEKGRQTLIEEVRGLAADLRETVAAGEARQGELFADMGEEMRHLRRAVVNGSSEVSGRVGELAACLDRDAEEVCRLLAEGRRGDSRFMKIKSAN